ncbi:RNA polymerase sigma factor [Mucilaginibacter humi]|uniref:RNA polymerase sigma factor n=1 Tax=Mucilaginibacter humi TaxID=2732510 RepID=UPI001FE4B149|nr:sigma-70 family RNA polymerase sigma factor [Mucilaginibacter humi]
MLAQPVLNPHKWVDNHADYLYAYAISRISDEEQARDLVQEVFLAALERAGKFEGKSTERTWLTAILKNKIVDVYRKRSSGLANIDAKIERQPDLDFLMMWAIGKKKLIRGNLVLKIMTRCIIKSLTKYCSTVCKNYRHYGWLFLP